MTDVLVKLKNGTVVCGPLWLWRPKEGFFDLVVEKTENGHILLDDVETAVENHLRVGIDRTDPKNPVPRFDNVDLLQRAREEGWKPKDS